MTLVSGAVTVAGQTIPVSAPVSLPGVALIGSSTELPFPVTVPRMGAYRHYMQPDDWSGSKQPRYGAGDEARMKASYDVFGVRDVLISFKPGYTAAKVRTFFASCPADLRLWVTHFHEHDMDIASGSLTVADYRAGCYQLADLAHEAGHLFGPVHNGSTRKSGATGTWGYWIDRWKAYEAPLEVCDFWGFDTYAETYQQPMPRLQPVLTYQTEHGLPLVIGEHAAPNTDPVKQAADAAAMRAWSLEHTALACWWQNQFTGEPPYPMTAATCRAWFGI